MARSKMSSICRTKSRRVSLVSLSLPCKPPRSRARGKRPENLDAYELYLRALAESRTITKEGNDRALGFLRQAIDIEPGYAAALAEAAFCYSFRLVNQWMGDAAGETAEGTRLARAAVAAGRDDATALAMAGYTLWWLGHDADAAISAVDGAAALNPNSAVACGIGGNVHAWAGNSGVAIERCMRAMRLSPRDPWTFLFFGGLVLPTSPNQRAHQEHPRGPLIFAALVSTYAHLGRLDEAREGLSRLVSFDAPTTAAWFQRFAALKNPVDRQFICEGLRKGGVPEA